VLGEVSQEREVAPEMDIDNRVPLLGGHLPDSGVSDDGGEVHRAVDSAILVDRIRDEFVGVL
jgi:hypothetical protein